MKKYFLALVLLVVSGLLCVLLISKKKCEHLDVGGINVTEKTQQMDTMYTTIVGGTTSSKYRFADHSTVVNKLLGNNSKTVILLHNSPNDMQVWYSLFMYIQSLKNNGKNVPTLLSYDLKGHGTAWMPIDPKYNTKDLELRAWDLKDFSNDLKEIYDTYVTSGKISIVGYGFGGTIAQIFALKHPQLIDKLYLICQSPSEMISYSNEYNYIIEWIKNNNNQVTYLTLPQSLVTLNMCRWYPNNNKLECPYPENANDKERKKETVEYLLAEKMMREANADTFLQIYKTLKTFNVLDKIRNANLSITFVMADNDHCNPLDKIKKEYSTIKNSKTKMYIVKGKHGFGLMHPVYIGKLIMDENINNDPLTLEIL